MPVAIRAITRLQDADDLNVSLGAGVDEYALCWDNDTARFVLRAMGVTDHGALTGLSDDDHSQYLLATGARIGASAAAQAFTAGVTVGSVTTAATLLQVAETSTASPRGIMSSQHSTGTDGARFHMRKSRGTNAAPTVITTGDVLGRLVASGYDGANYLEMGGIDIVSAGTIASTRVPTEIRFLTATDAAPSVLTQRMVIDKAGNVGIGTSVPGAKLDVYSTSDDLLKTNSIRNIAAQTHVLIANSRPYANVVAGDASLVIFQHTKNDNSGTMLASFGSYVFSPAASTGLGLQFRTGGATTRMVIDNTGFVGIGTTSPKGILHVETSNVAAGVAYNSFGDAYFASSDVAATDKGGTIALGGQFSSGSYAVFGRFAARLEGATGTPNGYFSIETVGTEGASYVMRERVRVSSAGVTTITHTDTTDAAVVNVLKLAKNVFSTGVGATGLGAGLLFALESSTTINTSAASVQAIIYEATHASRKFDLVGNAYDTAIREGWRVRGNGSAPAIGFLGATPIVRIAHVADPSGGGTVDAEARTAINSILTTLEGFGFHATS